MKANEESMTMEKPLVSMLVTCYNQKEFIEEALKSAFAQTYSPLEIVISDDCSTDGSIGLLEKLIREYEESGGSHSIVFNKNQKNLGVVQNFEKMYELSHGELLITAAGDDVSMPNRVERIVEEWVKDGKKAALITHSGVTIDAMGVARGQIRQHNAEYPLGAVMSYRRDVFSAFKAAERPREIVEDTLLAKRASFLGSELYIAEALLRYRIGSGSSTRKANRRVFSGWVARCGVDCGRQLLTDLESLSGILPERKLQEFRSDILKRIEVSQAWLDLTMGDSFSKRKRGFVGLRQTSKSWRSNLLHLVMLLPSWVYDPFYEMYYNLKTSARYDK